MKGGISGTSVIPGNPEDSQLIRRIRGLDGKPQMPMGFKPLPAEKIKLIEDWIRQGAKDSKKVKKHWAYVAPVRPSLPEVEQDNWVTNEVDRFVLAKLEQTNLSPSPQADKVTLIRRVYLDILGLPPTQTELDQYLSDQSNNAYESMVDRAFASPHYGERQAILWLDLARYADSNGYEADHNRIMYPYRDWVVQAFNRNLGYDQFTIEQLAGDMLPSATKDQIIAAGYHRNTMYNQEGGVDQEEQRWLRLVDRVGNTGSVWLGTTLACAQCHDHKYDPISQEDFYRFLAFFEPAKLTSLSLTPEADQEKARIAERLQKIEALLNDKATSDQDKLKLTTEKAVLNEVNGNLTSVAAQTFSEDVSAKAPSAVIRERGMFLSPGRSVTAGVPKTMGSLPANVRSDRLALAKWLVSDENPLTARVAVNRFWQQHFGKGLVATPGDFGTQGSPPSHPELLDWLAVELMDSGWDMKHIHKLIVMSSTYRQSSDASPQSMDLDPEATLLSRFPRTRLDAEILRDQVLAVSGLINLKLGGPSVFPYQPEGIWDLPYNNEQWVISKNGDQYRRSLYTHIKRSAPYPMFTIFDAGSRESCLVQRVETNTPLQALNMMNDPTVWDASRKLAKEAKGANQDEKLRIIFQQILIRKPSPNELARIQKLYLSTLAQYQAHPTEATKIYGEANPELASLTLIANTLFNLDEFLTLE